MDETIGGVVFNGGIQIGMTPNDIPQANNVPQADNVL